jgi:hypothetical protein
MSGSCEQDNELLIQWKVWNFLNSWAPITFSGKNLLCGVNYTEGGYIIYLTYNHTQLQKKLVQMRIGFWNKVWWYWIFRVSLKYVSEQSKPVFCNIFSLTALTNLSKTHDGTPQNFTSQNYTWPQICINIFVLAL